MLVTVYSVRIKKEKAQTLRFELLKLSFVSLTCCQQTMNLATGIMTRDQYITYHTQENVHITLSHFLAQSL